MSTDLRGAGRELRSAALEVHRLLVARERLAHESEHGPVDHPARMLELLMGHDRFAWLRPLSALIVALDEMLEDPGFTTDDAAAARLETETLMTSEALPFREKYVAALQDPDVVVAHARWRRAITALPRSRA